MARTQKNITEDPQCWDYVKEKFLSLVNKESTDLDEDATYESSSRNEKKNKSNLDSYVIKSRKMSQKTLNEITRTVMSPVWISVAFGMHWTSH